MRLEQMYQDVILDHCKHPHHRGLRDPFDAQVHHVNPTCGDEITLRVTLSADGERIAAEVLIFLKETPGVREAVINEATSRVVVTVAGDGPDARALAGIVAEALAICGDGSARITRSGPVVMLAPGAAVALALVLHELATSAIKFGALSNTMGTLAIAWSVAGAQVQVHWTERGGPAVSPPERRGFGSRLLETTIRRQLGGQMTLTYAPEGLECRIMIPLGERVLMRPT